MFQRTHHFARPADGRSVLHNSQSWLMSWAAPLHRPMSSCICRSHVLHGRFQSAAGGVFQLNRLLIVLFVGRRQMYLLCVDDTASRS